MTENTEAPEVGKIEDVQEPEVEEKPEEPAEEVSEVEEAPVEEAPEEVPVIEVPKRLQRMVGADVEVSDALMAKYETLKELKEAHGDGQVTASELCLLVALA